MAKDAKTTATPDAPKKERKVLTPEERIAKAEAELKALREKAEAKKNKERNAAAEKRAKIRDKMVELNTQHNDLTETIGDGAFSSVTIETGTTEAPAEATFTETKLEAV